MPLIGRYSFLQATIKGVNTHTECQCPLSGDTHFYEDCEQTNKKELEGVNALNRAILISTLPLWNRLI